MSDEIDYGEVRVKRAVYEAGERLVPLQGLYNNTAWGFAQLIAAGYHSYGPEHAENVAFWRAVYEYLMTMDCVDASTPVIIEDD